MTKEKKVRKKAFRMRPIPKKPGSKQTRIDWITIYDSCPMDEAIREVEAKGYYPTEASIEIERGCYGDSDSIRIVCKRLETDEEYAERLQDYEKRLAKYKKWYKDNREQVEEVKAARKAKNQVRYKKGLATQKARLEKELADLDKLLTR